MIKIFTTSTFYLKFKENNENDILLFQLFGPVLFSAHVYGSFAAADARLAELNQNIAKMKHYNQIWLKLPSFVCFWKWTQMQNQQL